MYSSVLNQLVSLGLAVEKHQGGPQDSHTRHGMAVLVQTLVQPELAGVLFTQAPMYRGQNFLLVEFVQGDRTSVVSGDLQGTLR